MVHWGWALCHSSAGCGGAAGLRNWGMRPSLGWRNCLRTSAVNAVVSKLSVTADKHCIILFDVWSMYAPSGVRALLVICQGRHRQWQLRLCQGDKMQVV